MTKILKPMSSVPISKIHIDPNWAGHNEHLIEGLNLHTPIDNLSDPGKNITSDVHLTNYSDPNNKNLAVVKPALLQEIEHIKRDYPEVEEFSKYPHFTTAHRESAYNKLSHDVFGLGNYTPSTTTFINPENKIPHSAQEYVKNPSKTNARELVNIVGPVDAHKLSIMNSIMGNNDRNKSNLLVSDLTKRPALIDNALTFDYHNIFGNPVPFYSIPILNENVPNSVHKWISGLDPKQGEEVLKAKGAPDHVINYFKNRIEMAKKWSDKVMSNDNYSGHLGGLLGILHFTKIPKRNELGDPKEHIKRIFGHLALGGKAGFNQDQFEPKQNISVNNNKSTLKE